jgi:hypothetical protein
MRLALYIAGMIISTIVGTASRAHAGGVLTTGPFARTDVPFICRIANVGTDEITVTIETVDAIGVVKSSGTFEVPPGNIRGDGVAGTTVTQALYCRFTLIKGSKSKVRALACVHSGTTTLSPCLATDVAR